MNKFVVSYKVNKHLMLYYIRDGDNFVLSLDDTCDTFTENEVLQIIKECTDLCKLIVSKVIT